MFRFILKCIAGLAGLVLLYLLVAFVLSSITISKEPNSREELSIYILTNGVHTDIVVPTQTDLYDWSLQVPWGHTKAADSTYRYLALGWGDKGFYLHTPEWKDLKASVALKAATGLSSTAIHATYHTRMEEGEQCRKINISRAQYLRLVDYITGSFARDANGLFQHIPTDAVYGAHDAFYEARGSYSMLRTCNTWANAALKHCGQKCCLWTAFDTGIFNKYKL